MVQFGKEARLSQRESQQILSKICESREEQDGGRVGGRGAHLSPRIHQEYTLRHRSAHGTPVESGQEYVTRGRDYIDPRKTREDEGTRGETGVLVGLDLPSAGGGTEAGVRSPHQGNCLSQRRNI